MPSRPRLEIPSKFISSILVIFSLLFPPSGYSLDKVVTANARSEVRNQFLLDILNASGEGIAPGAERVAVNRSEMRNFMHLPLRDIKSVEEILRFIRKSGEREALLDMLYGDFASGTGAAIRDPMRMSPYGEDTPPSIFSHADLLRKDLPTLAREIHSNLIEQAKLFSKTVFPEIPLNDFRLSLGNFITTRLISRKGSQKIEEEKVNIPIFLLEANPPPLPEEYKFYLARPLTKINKHLTLQALTSPQTTIRNIEQEHDNLIVLRVTLFDGSHWMIRCLQDYIEIYEDWHFAKDVQAAFDKGTTLIGKIGAARFNETQDGYEEPHIEEDPKYQYDDIFWRIAKTEIFRILSNSTNISRSEARLRLLRALRSVGPGAADSVGQARGVTDSSGLRRDSQPREDKSYLPGFQRSSGIEGQPGLPKYSLSPGSSLLEGRDGGRFQKGSGFVYQPSFGLRQEVPDKNGESFRRQELSRMKNVKEPVRSSVTKDAAQSLVAARETLARPPLLSPEVSLVGTDPEKESEANDFLHLSGSQTSQRSEIGLRNSRGSFHIKKNDNTTVLRGQVPEFRRSELRERVEWTSRRPVPSPSRAEAPSARAELRTLRVSPFTARSEVRAGSLEEAFAKLLFDVKENQDDGASISFRPTDRQIRVIGPPGYFNAVGIGGSNLLRLAEQLKIRTKQSFNEEAVTNIYSFYPDKVLFDRLLKLFDEASSGRSEARTEADERKMFKEGYQALEAALRLVTLFNEKINRAKSQEELKDYKRIIPHLINQNFSSAYATSKKMSPGSLKNILATTISKFLKIKNKTTINTDEFYEQTKVLAQKEGVDIDDVLSPRSEARLRPLRALRPVGPGAADFGEASAPVPSRSSARGEARVDLDGRKKEGRNEGRITSHASSFDRSGKEQSWLGRELSQRGLPPHHTSLMRDSLSSGVASTPNISMKTIARQSPIREASPYLPNNSELRASGTEKVNRLRNVLPSASRRLGPNKEDLIIDENIKQKLIKVNNYLNATKSFRSEARGNTSLKVERLKSSQVENLLTFEHSNLPTSSSRAEARAESLQAMIKSLQEPASQVFPQTFILYVNEMLKRFPGGTVTDKLLRPVDFELTARYPEISVLWYMVYLGGHLAKEKEAFLKTTAWKRELERFAELYRYRGYDKYQKLLQAENLVGALQLEEISPGEFYLISEPLGASLPLKGNQFEFTLRAEARGNQLKVKSEELRVGKESPLINSHSSLNLLTAQREELSNIFTELAAVFKNNPELALKFVEQGGLTSKMGGLLDIGMLGREGQFVTAFAFREFLKDKPFYAFGDDPAATAILNEINKFLKMNKQKPIDHKLELEEAAQEMVGKLKTQDILALIDLKSERWYQRVRKLNDLRIPYKTDIELSNLLEIDTQVSALAARLVKVYRSLSQAA